MELDAHGKAVSDVEAAGARLVAITPQTADLSQAMIDEKKLDFDILGDPGNQVAEAYGIKYQMADYLVELYKKFGVDVPKHNGDESWTLPMPARLIIDREGVIRYAEISADYTVRPDIEHTLEALKSL